MTSRKRWLIIIGLFIISTGLFLGLSFIGSYSLNIKLVAGSVIYFISTYYILKTPFFQKKILPFIIICFFPLFAFVFFNIRHFNTSAISFPSSLFIIISIISGFFFFKTESYKIPVGLAIMIVFWFAFLQMPFNNIRLYKTYNQEIDFNYPKVKIYDTTGNIRVFRQNNKYYFLDFWNTGCGPCYRLFPYIDSIKKLTSSPAFEFITVNVPIGKELKENNYRVLNPFKYSFEKLYAGEGSVIDSFQIEYYPTTIVVKNGKVVFRGDFKNAIRRFKVLQ